MDRVDGLNVRDGSQGDEIIMALYLDRCTCEDAGSVELPRNGPFGTPSIQFVIQSFVWLGVKVSKSI